jgi:hypothetical protein
VALGAAPAATTCTAVIGLGDGDAVSTLERDGVECGLGDTGAVPHAAVNTIKSRNAYLN